MKLFLKKHWSNLLILVVIVLLLFPQTSLPVKVFFNRMLMGTPTVVTTSQKEMIKNFNWELETTNGDLISFKDSKGKVVFLNFWATWCPPCVAEMPEIQSLYENYGANVDFYLVTQENPKIVKRFLQQKEYTFPVFITSQKAPAPINVQSIPRTLLISRQGEIIIDETGAADWDIEKVHLLLDKLLIETVN